MNPIDAAFAPMLGQTSWLVRHGHGSFLTLEFGNPELTVGDARPRTLRLPERDPFMLRARSAVVHGAWHLWIYCCEWTLVADEIDLAHSESDDVTISRALQALEGQALVAVVVNSDNGATRFEFDLGCRLITQPAPPGVYDKVAVDQWMLFQPAGTVLAVRSDGSYSVASKHAPPDEIQWLPMPM